MQHIEPAVGGAVEAAELKIKIAEPVGGIVTDRRAEVSRVEALERCELGWSGGFVKEFSCIGVVEESIGGLAGSRQRRLEPSGACARQG